MTDATTAPSTQGPLKMDAGDHSGAYYDYSLASSSGDQIQHEQSTSQAYDTYEEEDDDATNALKKLEDEPELAPIDPRLPDLDLAGSELDLTMTFESILADAVGNSASNPETEKVYKRASNVMKLAQENEKLKEELRAMTERLEAAERKQKELRQKAAQARAATATEATAS